jgi:hypothetical protein
MSMNPARNLASGVPAHYSTVLWLYFTAPLDLGILGVFLDHFANPVDLRTKVRPLLPTFDEARMLSAYRGDLQQSRFSKPSQLARGIGTEKKV